MNRRTDRLDGRIDSARKGDAQRGAQRDAATVLRIAWWVMLALAAACASEHAGAPRSANTPARGVAMLAPVALGAAIDRVRFAFRVEGDGWSGGHERYGVHATTRALSITPFLHEGGAAPGAPERVVAGAPASFEAAAVTRGGVALASGRGDGRLQADGHLAVARGEVVEESENRADGVEQRWSFARRPAGVGDLVVRVTVAGEPYAGETVSGLHFRDASTGLGVRYGHGTWVDAAGARTRVPARWDGRAIVLSVPSAVADAAAYPATLDPLISPEFGVDRAPPGPASGGEPALASDGHEFLLAWREGRAIVAGWIGPDGRALADGNVVLSVNQNALGQPVLNSTPVVASNGRGFLVAWKAQRYTGSAQRYEVHAARVDRERGVLDPGNLDLAGVQLGPISAIDVASNGRDYLVAWGRSNPAVAFFATIVSAEDAAIATVPLGDGDLRVAPHVASDGRDYLVTRGAQGARVGAAGALLDPGGIALPGGDAVAFDGRDYVVAWSEERGASGGDLFAAHVSTDGVVREPEGIAVSTAPNEQFAPRLSYDGRDVVVAWTDARASAACDPCALDPSSCSPCFCNAACSPAYTTTALYAARLTRAGLVRDPEGIAVTAPAPAPGVRSLTLASNDAATLLAWEGPPRADADGPRTIYGVRLTRSGVLRELRDPVLAHATNDQRAPAVAGDDNGGFLVVWQDYRNRAPAGHPPTFSWDVIGARVGAFGAFGRPVVISEAAGDQVAPAVTFDRGRYLVAWQDDRAGSSWDVYATRVSRGGVVRDPAGLALAAAPGDQTGPAVAGGLVVWTDTTGATDSRVRGTRVSLTGASLDPAGLSLSAAGENARSPTIAVDGAGHRAAWTSAATSPWRVVTARVDAAGAVRDAVSMAVTAPSSDNTPSVACGPAGCLLAWSRADSTRRAGSAAYSVAEIYGARVTTEGALSPPSPIALVFPFDPSAYAHPRVAPDGDGYLVAWEVFRARSSNGASASYEVLATRVTTDAASPGEAFAVAADGVGAYAPVIAANPGGPAIVVYLRSELGAAASAPARVVARLLTPGADCAGGACPGASCIPGFGNCDGVATNGCEASLRADPANCGACRHACEAGESCLGAVCVSVAPPRLIAPLSTATVTSRRPTLRWALAGGTDGARVEVCRDRPCATVVASFDAVGASGAPAADLPAGVLFWRTRGRVGTSTGTTVSPTWEFTVGARSAPVNASWGTTLDVNGDGFADVIVGAPNANGGAGRAYVYLGAAGGLPIIPATILSGPDGPGGVFGSSVASAGDVNGDGYADLVVGASGVMNNVGRAYVFLGGAGGLSSTPATTLTGPDGPNGYFGRSVASAGDVNGDGYADLVVGSSAGRAYVYLGSVMGIVATPTTSLTGPDEPGGGFGASVASAGDVNGDGYSDLVMGAPSVMRRMGQAYVYLGGAGGLAVTPATTLTGPDGANGLFGESLASAGDVNGDGYADLVVGARAVANDVGRAYVYLGGMGGLSSTPATTLAGNVQDGLFGHSVASAGDVDGDGYADLVVGTEWARRAYVYLGGVGGPSSSPAVTLTRQDGLIASFGRSVASGGDLNGDGFADVVVGAPGVNSVHVFLGSASGLPLTPSLSIAGPDAGSFGISVASAAAVPPGRPHAHHPPPTSSPASASPRPLRASVTRCMAPRREPIPS